MKREIHHYNNAYRTALRKKIDGLPGSVFKRADLSPQKTNKEKLRLNRALCALMDEGKIIKISHGVYAKAEKISLPSGKQIVALKDSFEDVSLEVLDKLGIQWEFGTAIKEYNKGKTTQVPAAFTLRLKSRFRGKIKAEGRSVIFEGGINAR